MSCSNAATQGGGLLDGGWSLGRPSHDEKLEILSPTFHSLGEGGGLKMELMIDHT